MTPPAASRRGAGLVVLAATLLALFAADRILLRVLGLPIWQYDPVLLYTHRPNMVAAWDSFPGDYPLRSNRWGFADDDFPLAKPPGEWRAVVVGDSVAMGFGLAHADALPDQLERRLAAHAARPVQVINAAVSGYGTAQYAEALRRALAFQPDLALVGVCLNDITDPHRGNQRRSGAWLAFRGVAESTDPILTWVIAETGFGRLAMRVRSRLAKGRRELAAVQYRERALWAIAHLRDDPAVGAQWQRTLVELDLTIAVASDAGVPIAVIVFPFSVQLGSAGQRDAQELLAAWAAERGVPLFDAAPPLDQRVAAGETAATFYLDELHFRPAGNAVIADGLAAWLAQQGMAPSS